MSDTKKVQEEELKKLEDEAYFELCQIIAEAMQIQDIELLDARIAFWKNKYRKLLDRPTTSSKSDFKKRIEFLLNQYYSSVTQYILNQLKLKEEKKIQNQAKAMRELYQIIKNTNDLDLLKNKVKKWEDKYPISGFLAMYQKRIELYTRQKNLRENAFNQEEAFRDLIDITKVYGTLDELKNELNLWEEKYSINNKFTIDDFIKHQSEVKRFTSDEFLKSIAREELKTDNVDKSEIDIVEDYNDKSFSNLSVQASSYASLIQISKSPNNINEMFKWVYKNNHIKFNDKYKELILSATYLEYSPTYLNKLQKPKIDISKNSLSFDEYKNINDIKRYAIISYFNLLLPPDKAISNDYFNKNIQTIYAKSEKAKASNDIKDESASINDIIDSGTEIPLKRSPENSNTISYVSQNILDRKETLHEEIADVITEAPVKENIDTSKVAIDLSDIKENLNNDLEHDKIIPKDIDLEIKTDEKEDLISKKQKEEITDEYNIEFLLPNNEQEEAIEIPSGKLDSIVIEKEETNTKPVNEFDSLVESYQEDINQSNSISIENDDSEENIDYKTIVALSPLFFDAINNYDNQAILVNHIDSAATKYVEEEKTKQFLLDTTIKTKNNLD